MDRYTIARLRRFWQAAFGIDNVIHIWPNGPELIGYRDAVFSDSQSPYIAAQTLVAIANVYRTAGQRVVFRVARRPYRPGLVALVNTLRSQGCRVRWVRVK